MIWPLKLMQKEHLAKLASIQVKNSQLSDYRGNIPQYNKGYSRRLQLDSWVGKICWRRDRLPSPEFLGFSVAQMIKNLPAMQETWVLSLGQEDPLEKGMAAHSSILAWRIPMDRGAWWTTQPVGSQRVGHDWATNTTMPSPCWYHADIIPNGEKQKNNDSFSSKIRNNKDVHFYVLQYHP